VIYKHLESIDVFHVPTAFVHYLMEQKELDRSHESLLLRQMVARYGLKKLFQKLDWKNEKVAKATALTILGEKLREYGDLYNATSYFLLALEQFHNQRTLQELIVTLLQMGRFEDAKKQIHSLEHDQKRYLDLLAYLKEQVDRMEKIAQEASIKEQEEILKILQLDSAPLYNAAGVLLYHLRNLEGAYGYFKKALLYNPIDQDIVDNTKHIAQILGREKEIKELLKRIFNFCPISV